MARYELVSFHLCPYVQKAAIALRARGVDYDITYIDLSDKPDWFLAISPYGKVPLLPYGLVVTVGTYSEFLLPVLIVLGLFTRIAALGMIGFTLVQSFVDITWHGARTQFSIPGSEDKAYEVGAFPADDGVFPVVWRAAD